MSDILIRDVPDEVVAAIDARAAALGLSRNEFLRRRLGHETRRDNPPVDVNDLQEFGSMASDLADSEVMSRAWS